MHTRFRRAVLMNSDFEELLRIFNANEVKYLIVGGYAVMQQRISTCGSWPILKTPRKFGGALLSSARRSPAEGPDDFTQEGFFYQIGRPPVRVDILMSIDGVKFAGRRIHLHYAA